MKAGFIGLGTLGRTLAERLISEDDLSGIYKVFKDFSNIS